MCTQPIWRKKGHLLWRLSYWWTYKTSISSTKTITCTHRLLVISLLHSTRCIYAKRQRVDGWGQLLPCPPSPLPSPRSHMESLMDISKHASQWSRNFFATVDGQIDNRARVHFSFYRVNANMCVRRYNSMYIHGTCSPLSLTYRTHAFTRTLCMDYCPTMRNCTL